ncbi:glycosyltransferase family 4 protein [Sulfitobacter sp.]|uniref:glycosyltransferase family 4 protein n=1 Tax=Sulfitobacter sp. TaxID=1903071 RepID=UPI0040584CFB
MTTAPQATDRRSGTLKIALDFSRARSGGAMAHLKGIIDASHPDRHGFSEMHIWSYPAALDKLPKRDWLITHAPAALGKSVFHQLWWQYRTLHTAVRAAGCDVLLSPGAATLCQFTPSVVMSRDMLSFEKGEMQRYPLFSKMRLRLWAIKYLQIYGLRKANGALFLTDYAAKSIQTYTGPLKMTRIIPHGISEAFREVGENRQTPETGIGHKSGRDINCICISPADLYKHQWNVIRAAGVLRDKGIPVRVRLIGASSGRGSEKVVAALHDVDPKGHFIEITGPVAHDSIPTELAKSDIFIFPSSCENMPNTLIEAMAAKLPIACSDRGPMPEMARDAAAYFDPESIDSIADALSRLIENDSYREQCADAAFTLARHYSWERCTDETWAYVADVAAMSPEQ